MVEPITETADVEAVVGDLLVEVTVVTPKNVSKKQEELLREFEKLDEQKPMEKVKSFFRKAKEAMGS